jgi:hypothetical protein
VKQYQTVPRVFQAPGLSKSETVVEGPWAPAMLAAIANSPNPIEKIP